MLLFTAQIVAILSVLLLAVGYLKADLHAASARVFGLIALCVVLYLMSGMTGPNIAVHYQLDFGRWQPLVGVTSSSISGLFMLYCFLIFQEAHRFPRARRCFPLTGVRRTRANDYLFEHRRTRR
jgi:hypothetical protein